MSEALENRVITERLLAATAIEPSSTLKYKKAMEANDLHFRKISDA
jgi:hypothetical protein